MGEQFYSKGLHFSCKQCSGCCRHDPGFVYLSKTDLSNLCSFFNISKNDFIATYCRVVPYYDGSEVICLQEKHNYDCIFWDGGCTVYGARPIQCSTYPFWTFILESENTWNKESTSCPGINTGNLLKENEICDRMYLYKNNRPLKVSTDHDTEDTIH